MADEFRQYVRNHSVVNSEKRCRGILFEILQIEHCVRDHGPIRQTNAPVLLLSGRRSAMRTAEVCYHTLNPKREWVLQIALRDIGSNTRRFIKISELPSQFCRVPQNLLDFAQRFIDVSLRLHRSLVNGVKIGAGFAGIQNVGELIHAKIIQDSSQFLFYYLTDMGFNRLSYH